MRTYQMPCLKKAVSQNRLSTSLTMMKDPTQASWTVETVLGMCVCSCEYTDLYVLPYRVMCIHSINGLYY